MSLEAAGITVLLCAIAGAAAAVAGVTHGWAYAHAHDIRPSWAPFSPGVELVIDLGWWNCSGVMVSPSIPHSDIQLESDTGVRVLGVATVLLCIAVSGLALYCMYLLGAKPCGRELTAMQPPRVGQTALMMMYTSATCGAVVLLFAVVLYSSLAIGAHKALKHKSAQFGVDLDIWPLPGWAFAGAAVAGCGLLAAARVFQGVLADSPDGLYGYQRLFRSDSFSFS